MIQRSFIYIFLSALITLADASTWTLNLNTLEQSLPLGVSVDEVTRVLDAEGIEVRFIEQEASVLWRGKWASISLAAVPFAPFQLWAAIDGRETLDECTRDELAELYEAIWMGRQAIAETIGASGFMIFTTEQPRNGKGNSVGFEIIPSGFDDNDSVMDAVEKSILNDYVFYNRSACRKVAQDPGTILAIRERLSTLHLSVIPEKPQSNWSQRLARHTEALHLNLQSIHDILVQSGALVEGEMPPLPHQEDKILENRIDLHGCAFCNPKVIQKQIVCDWKNILILMSHKPISPHGNFLIIPKRHQCAWDLTRDEVIESLEAVIALKKTFSEMLGSNNWICYIQDGPTAGQTVPHTHMHFYVPPSPLKAAISSLQHIHNQRPILSYEEMRANCERVKPFLLSKLQEVEIALSQSMEGDILTESVDSVNSLQ